MAHTQITLGRVLVSVALLAGFIWLAVDAATTRPQAVPGKLYKESNGTFALTVDSSDATSINTWIDDLLAQEVKIATVRATAKGFDNACLAALRRMPSLQLIDVRNTQVDDDGASYLIQMRDARSINISNSRITSVGVSKILRESNLKHLWCDQSQLDLPCMDAIQERSTIRQITIVSNTPNAVDIIPVLDRFRAISRDLNVQILCPDASPANISAFQAPANIHLGVNGIWTKASRD
jgi:hypothetical protein